MPTARSCAQLTQLLRYDSAISDMMGAYKQKVEFLDLSWNDLGPEEAAILARAIDEESSLKVLNLAGNSVAGAAAEYGAMLANSKLEEVDFSSTDMRGKELKLVASGLIRSSTIRKMNLSGNPLGPVGIRAVVQLLVAPPEGLRCIYKLWDCDFKIEDEAETGGVATDAETEDGAMEVQEIVARKAKKRGGVVDSKEVVDDDTIAHLLWVLESCFNDDEDRKEMLDAICFERYPVRTVQAYDLAKVLKDDAGKPSLFVDALCRLFPLAVDKGKWDQVVMARLAPHEAKQFRSRVGAFYTFGDLRQNDTGRFLLDLDEEGRRPCDRQVALLLIKSNLRARDRVSKEGGLDLSQKGNGNAFRNEKYNGHPFKYHEDGSVHPFDLSDPAQLPSTGLLELDFCTPCVDWGWIEGSCR